MSPNNCHNYQSLLTQLIDNILRSIQQHNCLVLLLHDEQSFSIYLCFSVFNVSVLKFFILTQFNL